MIHVESLHAQQSEEFSRRHAEAIGDLADSIAQVYGTDRADAIVERLTMVASRYAGERPPSLRQLDRHRETNPDWLMAPNMTGYVCYVDRFADKLSNIGNHVGYLRELGVTYLHLMPLLACRAGQNDGGYAVVDYRRVEERLGTIDDLRTLADSLRTEGISLCVDLVLNHTAREHEWARRAAAGDETFRRYYLMFPDRTEPDRYEDTLREVFPEWAPGNFTWVEEATAWVWTTFKSFQWDLDYSNPDVLVAMADNLLFLANCGVEVFRLDAVPFMWKEVGTGCENLPQVHQLLRALRAVARMAAPAVAFKAEAIVSPEDLVQYLGAGHPERIECDLAYNNQLMVMLWNSLATREARLMSSSLQRMQPKPERTAWVTYVRCHDDIGWAVTDTDAASMGWDGHSHRSFLSQFYAGSFDGSFARGALFQVNPVTGDSRISGSTASLAGVDIALRNNDADALEVALRRIELIHAIAFSFGGVPLLYMGDELALLSDVDFADEPGHGSDNRWLHRPRMDWRVAARRHDPSTVEHRMFARIAALTHARSETAALHGRSATTVILMDDPALFCFQRDGGFLFVGNFSDTVTTVQLPPSVSARSIQIGQTGGRTIESDGRLVLPQAGFAWIIEDRASATTQQGASGG